MQSTTDRLDLLRRVYLRLQPTILNTVAQVRPEWPLFPRILRPREAERVPQASLLGRGRPQPAQPAYPTRARANGAACRPPQPP